MSEPVTTGALAVALLAKVADAGFGELAKSAVKDAYDGLKGAVRAWAGDKVDTLEAAPDSEKLRREIATAVDTRPPLELVTVRQLTQDLADRLETDAGSIGMDLSFLRDVKLKLKNIEAGAGGIGVRVTGAVGGTIEADGIKAGAPSLK